MTHLPLHSRVLSGRKGYAFSIETAIIAILGLIVLIVVIILFTRSAGGPIRLFGSTETTVDLSACYSKSTRKDPTTPCAATDTDRDGDCLPDACDPCIDRSKPIAKTDAAQRAMGSNLYDADKDSIPDACDPKPTITKESTCIKDKAGRCTTGIAQSDEYNKPLTLTSVPSEKLTPESYGLSHG